MHDEDLNELAGRVDGVARAVLQLTALLEQMDVVDGARLTGMWRAAVAADARGALAVSRATLHDMAGRLDEARTVRRPAPRALARVLH